MAFDRTNRADLLALKNELEAASYVAADGSRRKILALLNDPVLNPGAETAPVVLTVDHLLGITTLVVDLDKQKVSAGARSYITALLSRDFAEDIDRFRGHIERALGDTSDTVITMDAMTRPLSRAEAMFGEGAALNAEDWWAGRDS